jgi:Ca-activated chloride channel homolog
MPRTPMAHSLPSPAPAAPSGLMVPGREAPIPLEHVHVDAKVVDLAARVSIRQRYRNVEQVPLEVVYVFPLDEAAAVCGFSAHVDGVHLEGVVREREEAFRTYDDAMEAGHGAFLLDEARADVLTVSLGNVKPGSIVDLDITYVTELPAEGQGVRFTLPTTVSPRYAPADDQVGVGPTPAEEVNPPVNLDVPYRFTFDMDVVMSAGICGIESPSHSVGVEIDGTHARVRLAQRDAAMDSDLVIVIGASGLDVPRAVVERSDKGEAVMVSFVPSFGADGAGAQPGAAEVVFVIDRSGSMGGDSIAEVRNALQLCLRSLRAGCRFNIVGFGSTFSTLFPQSRAYDEASLAEAAAFVASVDADMGGTEILPALEHVVAQTVATGVARQVVLLTDGEVSNTDAVLALAKRHAGTTRFFTFGIGAGASHHLVRGMARASGGAAEFIAPGERIEAKVMRQFRRLLAPAFLDARVAWPGGVTPAPAHLPAVFEGDRLVAYGLADRITAGTATLSGTLAGRAVRFEVPVDPAHAIEGTLAATLAARARIRDLEEEQPYLEARASRQGRTRSNRTANDEIVALAVKYQLVSRETSFVAIEHRETPTAERAELRRVPIALTRGWGGVQQRSALRASISRVGTIPIMSSFSLGGMDEDAQSSGPDVAFCCAPSREHDSRVFRRVVQHEAASPRLSVRRTSPSRTHDALVGLQRADGSWDLDAAFAKTVGKRLSSLEKALRGASGDEATVRRALATAIAIAWLERHAKGAQVEWELLAAKGADWLRASGVALGGSTKWIDWISQAGSMI